MKPFEYLKQIPVFTGLTDSDLEKIHEKTVERVFRKGAVIFFEGDPGEGFHYVQRGKVKIVKISDDGREHIIKVLSPGDLFAEVLLFNNEPYPATSVAIEDSKIGIIKNVELEKLVLSNNALALQLIKALSNRLLYTQQKIKNLALDDVIVRTGETLLKLAQEHGRALANGGVEISLDISRQDLGSLVGTTRETVTRTLSTLKKSKVIDLDGSKIIIPDLDKLRRWVGQ
jgi:CRP/FNR family transcriptional regulator